MKIGILKTDTLKPEFAKQFGEYPDMFARCLLVADPALEFITYDVCGGHYPDYLDEVDAYLITGSRCSVYDNETWIYHLKKFIEKLHHAQKKLVGICFGHQLVAEALGGKVAKADCGWCVGVQENRLHRDADFLGITRKKFYLLSNHQDQVQVPAQGARVLASTTTCPISMSAVGRHTLTFQGHPEFEKEFAKQLLDMRRHILGETLYYQALNSLGKKIDNDKVVGWIIDFISR